jgi:hypothetical protein
MDRPALHIPYDVVKNIAANRDILTPADFVAFSLTCRQFHEWMSKHLADSAAQVEGYPDRQSLIGTYRCYCGRIDWNTRYQCDCFVKCDLCDRRLPTRLSARNEGGSYCGFPCSKWCNLCSEDMCEDNIDEFRFYRGQVLCCLHIKHSDEPDIYEWEVNGVKIRSLFADELCGADDGPIPWELIARYDPDHPILTFKNTQFESTCNTK